MCGVHIGWQIRRGQVPCLRACALQRLPLGLRTLG